MENPTHLMPGVAMLAYGWVFHMGFFNFYLALGLCFWALAIAWNSTPARLAGATVVLMVAYSGKSNRLRRVMRWLGSGSVAHHIVPTKFEPWITTCSSSGRTRSAARRPISSQSNGYGLL